MARVNNWQLGREMSYWYPESRPEKQFAAVFDINKGDYPLTVGK